MSQAVGIHAHEYFKLGLVPHEKTKDELIQVKWRVDPTSAAPTEVDHMTITPGLDGNDKYGDCGPTSADNIQRIITKYESGQQFNADEEQVLTLYSESSNPPFDQTTGANDNGVENPDLYSAWRKNGLAGQPGPIAYGQLADTSDASLALAIDVFGAVTMAVDLETAQQNQSEQASPIWDHVQSSEWGGHDVCVGAISKSTGLSHCYSWAILVAMTESFRQHQMLEVFVPLFASVYQSDKFDALVGQATIASAFKSLTGDDLVVPTPPTPAPPQPTPTPTPTSGLQINLSDTDVIRHITHAAGVTATVDEWATRHFRSYFKVKD